MQTTRGDATDFAALVIWQFQTLEFETARYPTTAPIRGNVKFLAVDPKQS
jgi:hypothetical protein